MPEHTAIDTDSFPAHQFDDPEQQREAVTLGMWAFLVTEVMFFSGLFVTFTIYRSLYPRGFAEGSSHLYMWLGATNTAILLTSSLCMAMAVRASQLGNRGTLVLFLGLTLLLGAAFLGVKGFEYFKDYQEQLVPAIRFNTQSLAWPRHVELFMVFYFIMTALHATHMVIGVGLLAYLIIQSLRRKYSPAYHTPVEMIGLYWHFVDIVWIFLFPLLYLSHHG